MRSLWQYKQEESGLNRLTVVQNKPFRIRSAPQKTLYVCGGTGTTNTITSTILGCQTYNKVEDQWTQENS